MESLVDIANETAAQRAFADTLSVCQLICHTDCHTACPFFSEADEEEAAAVAAAAVAAVAAPKRLARHRSMGV